MIAIGSDHGGFLLKQEVLKYLDENNISYKDFGTFSVESCDYPDVAKSVAISVSSGEFNKGLLFCGTGLGMSIAANKIKNIRAICSVDSYSVRHSRLHNDANILCLGGRVIGIEAALDLINIFLNTEFELENPRHKKRLDMIKNLEK